MSAGDFHQLPPVGAKLLCNALVQDCISVPSKLTGKPLKSLKFGNQSPGKKGIRLFRKFERYKLTVNQRSKNDDRWAGILLRMRNTKSAQPVSADFIDPVHGVQPLSTAEAKTDEWADAQISCLGHAEGDVVSAARAYQFATRHGRVLVRWRLPLCGREAEWLSPQKSRSIQPRFTRTTSPRFLIRPALFSAALAKKHCSMQAASTSRPARSPSTASPGRIK